MHSRDHDDSEYVSYAWINRKAVEFIGHKFTHKHTDTELYILVQSVPTTETIIRCLPCVCVCVCLWTRYLKQL